MGYWKIVRKSNFNKELFEEKFVENLQAMSQGEAEEVAEALNKTLCTDRSEYIIRPCAATTLFMTVTRNCYET